MHIISSIEQAVEAIGHELDVAEWVDIDQERIDARRSLRPAHVSFARISATPRRFRGSMTTERIRLAVHREAVHYGRGVVELPATSASRRPCGSRQCDSAVRIVFTAALRPQSRVLRA